MTVIQQAEERLRRLILDMEIGPGERLTERWLEGQTGPREALSARHWFVLRLKVSLRGGPGMAGAAHRSSGNRTIVRIPGDA